MAEGDMNGSLDKTSSESLFSGICKLHPDKKAKYGVTLTKTEILFDQVASINKKGNVSLCLSDVIGCEITTEGDQRNLSAIDEKSSCLTIYVYVRKSNKSKVVAGRKRRAVSVMFDCKASYSKNRDDAVTLKERILNVACSTGGKDLKAQKVLVLVNPKSGPGKALPMFQERVAAMFAEAGVQFKLVVTQKAGHAFEMMKDLNLNEWYGIVIVSGDGLIYEVVNGLRQRSDSETALKTPIGCLPGGSGNALSAAICHYAGESCLDNLVTNATYVLLKHQVLPLDFVDIELQSGERIFSFLSVTWGFMADVDIESEKYRFLGEARLALGAILRIIGLRKYRGRLSFLPVENYVAPTSKTKFQRSASEYATGRSEVQTVSMKKAISVVEEHNTSMASESSKIEESVEQVGFTLDEPQDLESKSATSDSTNNSRTLPPLSEPVPSDWVTLDREFVSVGIVYLTHMATDLMVSKDRSLTEGSMNLLILNHTISRPQLLKAFIGMSEGNVQPSSDLELVRISAFRLEPLAEKGIIAVDGEVVTYGAIQGHMVNAMGRVMAKEK